MVWYGQWILNSSMKLWLEKNGIKVYSTHNEETSVVAERFIRKLKIKNCIHISIWMQYQKMCILIN